ncbi:MAG: hypothetical protein QM762_16815 [Chryseolinea sp.]
MKVFGDLHEQSANADAVTFSVESLKGSKLPRVGIPLSDVVLSKFHIERINALSPDFISVVVRSLTDIERIPIALQFGLPLEIALFPVGLSAEEIALALKPYASHISQLMVLVEGKRSADGAFVESFLPSLRKHLPKTLIGSGTDAFFTELNRNPTPAHSLDFLSFSVNPQTHASDLRTMTENLVAHRDVVESCRKLSGGRGVRVGPVTLKMRWNPDATSAEALPAGSIPANVDSRQPSLYAAGWTLGSLKYLTEAGADMVTYYEMVGWRGLMSHPDQVWPGAFNVGDGQLYPVYVMLRLLLSQRGAAVLPLRSSEPLLMDGMAFRNDDETMMVVLANYTRASLLVTMPTGFQASAIRIVGSDNIDNVLTHPNDAVPAGKFSSDRFEIPAFGFVIIEGGQ